jgi:hypothetical protein
MSATATLLATSMLLSALDRATSIGLALKKAQDEGRDITDAELDAAVAADDKAKAELDAAIATARASGA